MAGFEIIIHISLKRFLNIYLNMNRLIAALVTPFKEDNRLDLLCFKKLIERVRDTHDGILLGGSTGEGDSLKEDELQMLIDSSDPKGLLRIIAISEDCTEKVIKKIASLRLERDDILLVRVPSYYLPSEEGIFLHFKEIFKTFPRRGFIIYNIPKRTSSCITARVLKRLMEECRNLIGIKDCTDDMDFVKKIATFIDVYSGNDAKIPFYQEAGAKGLISVQSQIFPELYHSLLHEKLVESEVKRKLEFIDFMSKKWSGAPNPIAIKMELEKIGYPSMNLRLPLSKSGIEL